MLAFIYIIFLPYSFCVKADHLLRICVSNQTTFCSFACQIRPPFRLRAPASCRGRPPFTGLCVSSATTFSVSSFPPLLLPFPRCCAFLKLSARYCFFLPPCPVLSFWRVKSDHFFAGLVSNQTTFCLPGRVKTGHLLRMTCQIRPPFAAPSPLPSFSSVDNFYHPGEKPMSKRATF